MSAKREKSRRLWLKMQYDDDLIRWVWSRPPKLLFWRYRKWKRSRPKKYNWMH